ncbi:MAG TPA: hypothetical protein VKQ71_12060 [Acidimicrobiales bacterium]|nr:hypothetical protein [Acidimicrobiales bacterium]
MAIPTFTLEIAFATSNPLTASPTYTDVSTYLMEATWVRGRQRELDRCEAGTATFVLDGYDWNLLPGYASSAYYPNVLPGKFIRLSATLGGTTTRLFTGYIDHIEVHWDQPGYSTVTITATDALALLNLLPIQGPFSQQTTGPRISALLTSAKWPSANTNIAAGVRTCPVITYVLTDNMTAGTAINQTADTEPGTFYADGSGVLQFFTGFQSGGSVGTIGDGATEVQLDAATLTVPDDIVYNDIRVTRTGGTGEQQVTDSGSITEFSRRILTKSTYNVSDADAVTTGGSYLTRYKYPAQLFDPVTFQPVDDNAPGSPFTLALACEIGKTVTIARTPPAALSLPRFSQSCVINHMEHHVTAGTGSEWTTTLRVTGASLH